MEKRNTKKAKLEIIVTNEEGRQIKRKMTGTNDEIAFLLGEAGILSNDIARILNAK